MKNILGFTISRGFWMSWLVLSVLFVWGCQKQKLVKNGASQEEIAHGTFPTAKIDPRTATLRSNILEVLRLGIEDVGFDSRTGEFKPGNLVRMENAFNGANKLFDEYSRINGFWPYKQVSLPQSESGLQRTIVMLPLVIEARKELEPVVQEWKTTRKVRHWTAQEQDALFHFKNEVNLIAMFLADERGKQLPFDQLPFPLE